ncbi:MAG: hypothetical protein QM772_12725 [Ottowia sp.]
MSKPAPSLAEARRALARSIGLAAFVYGYPRENVWIWRTPELQP